MNAERKQNQKEIMTETKKTKAERKYAWHISNVD